MDRELTGLRSLEIGQWSTQASIALNGMDASRPIISR